LGLLSLLASLSGFFGGISDRFTLMILGLVGACLMLKPLRNVRWAALMALMAGGSAAYLVQSNFQVSNAVLAIIFLAIAVISYLILKFIEDALRLVGSILAFPPISILIGTVAILHGILLLLGQSVVQFLHLFVSE